MSEVNLKSIVGFILFDAVAKDIEAIGDALNLHKLLKEEPTLPPGEYTFQVSDAKAKTVLAIKGKVKPKAKASQKDVEKAKKILAKPPRDPAKELANRAGNPNGGTLGDHTNTGTIDRIRDALKQTTGKVGSGELASILDLTAKQASNALLQLWEQGEVKREAGINVDTNKAIYLYWVEGKS